MFSTYISFRRTPLEVSTLPEAVQYPPATSTQILLVLSATSPVESTPKCTLTFQREEHASAYTIPHPFQHSSQLSLLNQRALLQQRHQEWLRMTLFSVLLNAQASVHTVIPETSSTAVGPCLLERSINLIH